MGISRKVIAIALLLQIMPSYSSATPEDTYTGPVCHFKKNTAAPAPNMMPTSEADTSIDEEHPPAKSNINANVTSETPTKAEAQAASDALQPTNTAKVDAADIPQEKKLNSYFFEPYQATYSTVYKKGISIKVEGIQTLTQHSPNTWQFDFLVETLIATLKESSTFTLDNGSLRPAKYHYSSKILGKNKEMLLNFDWGKMKVINDVKNKPWKMDINDVTLDRLTLQLQLRFDLLNQREQLFYDIADGGKLKRYTFSKQDIETIDTKVGPLEAIKVARTDNLSEKRHSYFWFAPKYNYLLVKMEHFEKGESYILDIEKITSPSD